MQTETFSLHTPDDVARIGLTDGESKLVLLFGSPDLDRAGPVIGALADRFPSAALIGCSTAGEILDDAIVDDTVSGAIVGFSSTRLAATSAAVDRPDASFPAGRSIAEALAAPDLRSVLVLSDGLGVNGSELVRGINSTLPPETVVTGGLAADGDRFQKTWVIREGRPVSGHVTAVGLYGDSVRVGHGSKGGWDIFGPEREVTRSEGNVLFELDGRPALALYKQYLGELASGLPATALLFPLAIRTNSEPANQIVRTVLAVDEGSQSMTFAGDIPQGSRAQLMQANFDRLIASAAGAATLARGPFPDVAEPMLSIAISCVGRRLILGDRCDEELEAALELLPEGTGQVGFYSYGEISPFTTGHCDLHNQTLTLTTISERAA